MYKNGADIILNASASHFEVGKLDCRLELVECATKKVLFFLSRLVEPMLMQTY